jgi:hypothetical protein
MHLLEERHNLAQRRIRPIPMHVRAHETHLHTHALSHTRTRRAERLPRASRRPRSHARVTDTALRDRLSAASSAHDAHHDQYHPRVRLPALPTTMRLRRRRRRRWWWWLPLLLLTRRQIALLRSLAMVSPPSSLHAACHGPVSTYGSGSGCGCGSDCGFGCCASNP